MTKSFGSFTAVNEVSFAIPTGSFFSILGPSGCGKTTLMRMIAGFEHPDKGNILIKGNSVIGVPPNQRNAKMVFQHLALFPMMNVADNIAYGLRCSGVASSKIDKLVEDALERVGLPGVGAKQIHQLSGGQKQRIAIARCMVLEPEVLLLDEPLGALDLKLREHMKVELKMLQRKFGTTFVYITHDQSEALVMSDQVAVMNCGRFEQIGTPRELYNNPKTAFVAGFVGDSNRWRGAATELSPEKARVRINDGIEVGCVPSMEAPLSKGESVDVFVRPNAISVITEDEAASVPSGNGSNALSGQVDSVLFNGSDSRVLVRADGIDTVVEAALPMSGPLADLQQGQRVGLRWMSSQSSCFPVND